MTVVNRANPELQFPTCKTVIVYLDIEVGVHLSSNYWYGWASKVYWYSTGFLQFPFYPGLYCTTVHNPDVPVVHPADNEWHRIPSGDVQDGLRNLPNNLASRCYGVYATNPQTDTTGFDDPALPMPDRYAPNFRADWKDRFDVWVHSIHILGGWVPWPTCVLVRLWQYGLWPSHPGNATEQTVHDLHVDLAESSPDSGAIKWMLKLR